MTFERHALYGSEATFNWTAAQIAHSTPTNDERTKDNAAVNFMMYQSHRSGTIRLRTVTRRYQRYCRAAGSS